MLISAYFNVYVRVHMTILIVARDLGELMEVRQVFNDQHMSNDEQTLLAKTN